MRHRVRFLALVLMVSGLLAGSALAAASVVSNPAGWSSSWATVAVLPSLSGDGRFAYYVERMNCSEHNIWKDDVKEGTRTLVKQEFVPTNSNFGQTFLVDDKYLVFTGIPLVWPALVDMCDVEGVAACWIVPMPPTTCFTVRGIRW